MTGLLTALERSRRLRVLLLVAGLVLPQVLLFGSSLCGRTVLLPLDILTTLLPLPGYPEMTPHNRALSDLVLLEHQARVFSTAEWRAGRVPLWDPMSYAGAPFALFGKYNPFELPFIAFPSPATLAWMQLAEALVAGIGAYLFFRSALGARALPSLLGAWCYPLTGFFMFWQGYCLTFTLVWLPWVLQAAWLTVRRKSGWGVPLLSMVTAFALLGGHLDVACQVLLVAGTFALWAVFDRCAHARQLGGAVHALTALVLAWTIGFALAAPHWLPLIEYARAGDRIIRRQAGAEERSPVGLSILPQTVVPDFYGTTLGRALYLGPGTQAESAAGTYTGLLATLLVSPLAWCSRRNRRQAWFWLGVGVFTLGWQLNLPGVVHLLRLPGLNLMSHNRFVFATSFAILTLAVIALDGVTEETPRWRPWFFIPVGLLLVLGAVCVVRGTESLTQFAARIEPLFAPGRIPPEVLGESHAAIARTCRWAATLCVLAVAAWGWLAAGRGIQPWFVPVVGLAIVTEVLVFAWDRVPQCDPRLYYPRSELLERLAHAPPGRVLAVGCLQANLHESYGLREVRGYDGIDPKRLVELLAFARDPRSPAAPNYARLAYYVPLVKPTSPSTLELSRILDMLNVRYLLFAGSPRQDVNPLLEGDGFFVMENPRALPRVFIPRQVRMVRDEREVPALLAAPDFDPRETAYVERMESAPQDGQGTAEVVEEVPTSVRVVANMQTPGLLVLADQWNDGWRAYVDGRPTPIVRADYVLRGVVVPAGRSTILFRYAPESLRIGVYLLGTGLLMLLANSALTCRRGGEP